MIDYDGRRFRPVEDANAAPGRVAVYHQDGELLWGEFLGGRARRGVLTGLCAPDGSLDFAYCMVTDGGDVISGHCTSTPQILDDGRIRLHEVWERFGRHASRGTSAIEEIGPGTGSDTSKGHDMTSATDTSPGSPQTPGPTQASTSTGSVRASERPRKGGTVTWACAPGFPPAVIFPFTPAERMGMRNILEFQALMYRTLYYFGSDGTPEPDYENSIGEPPQWSEDGLTVTVRVKPWKWANGETLCADNVLFWVNLMKVKGSRYGEYVPGYFPDNCTSYGKLAEDTCYFTFDKKYSKRWVLMNQLSMITPLPRAWDRTADGPANASGDLADVEAVYEYLMAEQGNIVEEGNEHRTRWADSPIWSVVSGPWRLKSYTLDGVVTFVPNEHYSGPHKPYLDEFRQVPTFSDEEQYKMLTAGPDGPGAIQVGYLPLSFATEPTDNPAVGGANPLDEHYRLVPQVAFCIRYISLNYNNPGLPGKLFAQTYLRQAMQSCLDQDRAAREIYQGYAYRQNGPIPLLPQTDLVSPRQRGRAWPLPFDPERARQLLAENGWDTSTTPAVCVDPAKAGGIPAGTKLSLLLRYVEGRPALTQLMAQFKIDAARAGIELRLEEVYGSILVAEDAPCEPSEENPCEWQMCCWNGGWVYHFPSGEVTFKTRAGGNFGFYSDPKADELIEKSVTTDDLEALYEYQDYIAEQVPVIFTPNFPIRLFEVAKGLRGFEPINPLGMISPENWYYFDGADSINGADSVNGADSISNRADSINRADDGDDGKDR